MLDDLRTSHLTQPRSTRAGQALTLGCVALAGTLLVAVAEGRGELERSGAVPLTTLDGPLFHDRARAAGPQAPARPADNGDGNHETDALWHFGFTAFTRMGWNGPGRHRATPAR